MAVTSADPSGTTGRPGLRPRKPARSQISKMTSNDQLRDALNNDTPTNGNGLTPVTNDTSGSNR
jgi:hypothetical protein